MKLKSLLSISDLERAAGRRLPPSIYGYVVGGSEDESSLRANRAGFERWKQKHTQAASHLEPADVLVDSLRGRHRTWTRVRVNLQHVPANLRPPQEPLDPNEILADEWHRTPSRARKES